MKFTMIQASRSCILIPGLFLFACSSMDIEPRVSPTAVNSVVSVDIDQPLKVARVWSGNVGSVSRQDFSKLLPAVSEQAIFTVSEQGELIAWHHQGFPLGMFNQKIWQRSVGEEVSGGVFEGYGLVLLASSKGKVFAFDSETGEQRWVQELDGEILSPPQANGRFAIVQMADGRIQALDFRSGDIKWVYKTTVPALTLRGTSTPLIEQDRVYAGFANGKLVALDILTGAALWEVNIYLPEGGTELEQVIDIDGKLLIDNERIVAASYQGKVAALYKQNGRVIWKNNASNYVGLEKGLNQIYSVEDNGLIHAYDATNGSILWTQDKLEGHLLSAPATQGNYLLLGDSRGYLYWMRQNDGVLVARKYLGRGSIADYHHWNFKGQRNKENKPEEFRVFSNPVIYKGRAFVQNRFGAIVAYEIRDK